MLRIGVPQQPPTQPEPAMDPSQGDPTMDPMAQEAAPLERASKAPKYEINKVSPDVAGYKDPSAVCGNCEFFDGQGGCHIVEGQIDPTWHCNLFTALGQEPVGQEEEPDNDESDTSSEPPDDDGDEGEQPDVQK